MRDSNFPEAVGDILQHLVVRPSLQNPIKSSSRVLKLPRHPLFEIHLL